MKKWMILSIMLGAMPLSMMAQDDMYFVPKKQSATPQTVSTYKPTEERPVTHSGSWRNVDEYNRRGTSSYEELPADTSDVVNFTGGEGVYPDSIGDFAMTRRMERWDDYVPSSDYWDGYSQGRRDSWGWHSPWYYSSFYPWYDSWYYDPWYYSWYSPWHYGWYDPWYYGYGYGWGWHGYYNSWYYRPWHYYSGGYAYHYGNKYGNSSIGRGTRDRYGRTNGIGYDGRSGRTYASGTSRSTTSGRSYGTRNGNYNSSSGVRSSSSGSYSRSNSNAGRSYSGSSSSSSSSRSYGGSSSSGSYSRSSGSSGSFSGGSSHSSSSRGGGGGGGRSGGGRR